MLIIFHRTRYLEFHRLRICRNVRDFTAISPLFSRLDTIQSISSTAEKSVLDKDENENESFTYSYLVNSCGLAPQIAKSASKRLKLDSPDRPNSVLNLLKNQGFTDSHISRLLKRRPRVLTADPDNVLPKFQFFMSKGASSLDLATIFSNNAGLLERSLDKHIIPCYNALKTILLDDDKVLKTLRRSFWYSTDRLEKYVALNISVLKQHGLPQSSISYLITNYPSVIYQTDEKFDYNIKKVVKLGFDPLKISFVDALVVISGMSEETTKFKLEVYNRWLLSEDAVWLAFKKNPICFRFSEKKIMTTLDFLVKEMGFEAEDIIPYALTYSLEKRIIPRCSVIRVLRLKGLIKDGVGLYSILTGSDDYFITRFVVKYMDEVPQLLDIFQGKVRYNFKEVLV